jgi:adenosine deaminase
VKFAAVFARARAEGYLLTMHCDVNQENSVAHIRQAVETIGVARIDHGVNLLEDAELTEVVRARKLALTVCPISNSFVTKSSQWTVIDKMLTLDMRVTLNSDDPAYFGGYITENFLLVQRELDLGIEQMRRFSANAFEAAWLPRATRDAYLAQVAAYGDAG